MEMIVTLIRLVYHDAASIGLKLEIAWADLSFASSANASTQQLPKLEEIIFVICDKIN